MTIVPVTKKKCSLIMLSTVLMAGLGLASSAFSQAQRNSVLEFCTGTWCQWCPCGDDVVVNEILPQIPNAIILAYHGAGSDPFKTFHGSDIISQLGLNAYPSGVVDRVTGIVNYWDGWMPSMSGRLSVPATVKIELIEKSYNPFTREFSAIFEFTALQDLLGEFRFTLLLLEDDIVYPQTSNNTCTPGTSSLPAYIHDWLVRDIMNGTLGEVLVTGEWNQNQVIRKTFNYSVPEPATGPDIVPNNCRIVAKVHRTGTPLNSNAEIQQAEQWPLMEPGYGASITAAQREALGSSAEPARFTAALKNDGVHADSYEIGLSFNGPQGWSPSFKTPNGTFPLGQTDNLTLPPGDSVIVAVEVNANAIEGFGKAVIEFVSTNFVVGSVAVSFATFGVEVLVVDDEGSDYETYFIDAAKHLNLNYGLVSSALIPPAVADMPRIQTIFWACAVSETALDSDEQNALAAFLENGGRLFLSGVDIAYQLADSTSPHYSQNSLAFFTNYLHASYLKRENANLIAEGIAGDPITDGFTIMGLTGGSGARTINPQAGLFANQIEAADSGAVPIFHAYQKPNEYLGIRALHQGSNGTGKVVFTTFGFETINRASDRQLLAARVMDWFNTTTHVAGPGAGEVLATFELWPNYPNPFNPGTRLAYSLPANAGDNVIALVIFNQVGQRVRTLVYEKQQAAGNHEIFWDGRDDRGAPLASGVYYSRLRFGEQRQTRKMVLLR